MIRVIVLLMLASVVAGCGGGSAGSSSGTGGGVGSGGGVTQTPTLSSISVGPSGATAAAGLTLQFSTVANYGSLSLMAPASVPSGLRPTSIRVGY